MRGAAIRTLKPASGRNDAVINMLDPISTATPRDHPEGVPVIK
jgi:hypothetical protein